jgi:hypothetical protein
VTLFVQNLRLTHQIIALTEIAVLTKIKHHSKPKQKNLAVFLVLSYENLFPNKNEDKIEYIEKLRFQAYLEVFLFLRLLSLYFKCFCHHLF